MWGSRQKKNGNYGRETRGHPGGWKGYPDEVGPAQSYHQSLCRPMIQFVVDALLNTECTTWWDISLIWCVMPLLDDQVFNLFFKNSS